jgi:hypothetical protein
MVATDEAVDWAGGLDALIEQIAPTDYCAGDDPTVHNIDLYTTGCLLGTR